MLACGRSSLAVVAVGRRNEVEVGTQVRGCGVNRVYVPLFVIRLGAEEY